MTTEPTKEIDAAVQLAMHRIRNEGSDDRTMACLIRAAIVQVLDAREFEIVGRCPEEREGSRAEAAAIRAQPAISPAPVEGAVIAKYLRNIRDHLQNGVCGQREVWVEQIEEVIRFVADCHVPDCEMTWQEHINALRAILTGRPAPVEGEMTERLARTIQETASKKAGCFLSWGLCYDIATVLAASHAPLPSGDGWREIVELCARIADPWQGALVGEPGEQDDPIYKVRKEIAAHIRLIASPMGTDRNG